MRRIRFDPNDELAGLRSAVAFQRQMDRLIDGLLEGSIAVMRHAPAVWHPAFDVLETPESYFITVDIAGVPAESVEVTVQDRTLVVRGVRHREPLPEEVSCRVMEINYGLFEREVRLTESVATDDVNAELRDGFLRITLRKIKGEPQRRRVTVQ